MFLVSKELLQQIANYLQTKPYVEVHALITELLALKPVEEAPLEPK